MDIAYRLVWLYLAAIGLTVLLYTGVSFTLEIGGVKDDCVEEVKDDEEAILILPPLDPPNYQRRNRDRDIEVRTMSAGELSYWFASWEKCSGKNCID